MKAIIRWSDGSKEEIQHAEGFGLNQAGLVLLNSSHQPIAVIPFGLGSLIFPEHDTELLTGKGLTIP